MKKFFYSTAIALGLAPWIANYAHATDLVCEAPIVFIGAQNPDLDPVTSLEVSYTYATHAWQVFHHHASGLVAARMQQYAWEDATRGVWRGWAGSLNRNRSLYMVGRLSPTGYYEEWLYNRSQGNRLDVHLGAWCHVVNDTPVADPTWTRRPAQPEPAPAPAPGPTGPNGGVITQQNGPSGPVINNNTTTPPPIIIFNNSDRPIREIPGPSYTPRPKDEPEKGS